MNNEEKANKIAMPCPACPCIWTKEKMYNQEYCKDCVSQDRFTGAMEMAQWKDEQFNKFLLWLDDNYVIRRFKDGESMTYAELVNEFKNMDYERDNQAKD